MTPGPTAVGNGEAPAPDLSALLSAAPDPAGSGGHEAAVRRAGFAALLSGRAPTVAELAAATGVAEEDVASAIGAFESAGRATLDGGGRVDGIAGLTRRPTRHSIVRPDALPLQTWCAFDAVAIPAALGWTATAVTTCGSCGADLTVVLDGGEPLGHAWGWLPPDDCDHILRDFCAAADLFCNQAHLDTWRKAAGHRRGEAHPVGTLAALGRTAWADCIPYS